MGLQVVLFYKFSWEFLTADFRRRFSDLMNHENFLRLQVQIVWGRYVDLIIPRLFFNNLASFNRIFLLFLFWYLLAKIRDILIRDSSLITIWELMGLNEWFCQLWLSSTFLVWRMNLHLCLLPVQLCFLKILSAFEFIILSLWVLSKIKLCLEVQIIFLHLPEYIRVLRSPPSVSFRLNKFLKFPNKR